MIRLESVTKIYPGEIKAVDSLSLRIEEGEICTFVGPSGCGKTTTLKMINRLIEPTSGRIFIGDENVSLLDPTELRRDIGYVIQEIGLFPHMTIAANISCVPTLKGWSEGRKQARVDELLHLMGMEPGEFRDNYPRELSGGQRQRIGVARALGADPPILLMDEPFGAIDPITRDRLQEEFLNLQHEMKKTVAFVTHDINEAIRMGDKVAIFREGRLVQHDQPERILAQPKDAFVEGLVGSDRTLKLLRLVEVQEVLEPRFPVLTPEQKVRDARKLTRKHTVEGFPVVDERGILRGYLSQEEIRERKENETVRTDFCPSVTEETNLQDALSEMLMNRVSALPVVDSKGKFCGVVTSDRIQGEIREKTRQGED